MIHLKSYQTAYIATALKKDLLAFPVGSGKTATVLHLAEHPALVVCPKQQVLDRTWEKEAKLWNLPIPTIISKETFRRDHLKLPAFKTLVYDEIHTGAGLHAEERTKKGERVPKTSQLFDALTWYLKNHNPERVYLLSATPMTKPMSLFAIALLLGKQFFNNFYKFRNAFYIHHKRGRIEYYIPKKDKDSRDRLARFARSIGTFIDISEYQDTPQITEVTKYFKRTAEQIRVIGTVDNVITERAVENGVHYLKKIVKIDDETDQMSRICEYVANEKLEYLVSLAFTYPKLVIFANFTGQVENIKARLFSEGFNCAAITGQTKDCDRQETMARAETEGEFILIIQSGISSGWRVKSCHTAVWASFSARHIDLTQGQGRLISTDLPDKKITYIYLCTLGGSDFRCYKAVKSGHNFNEELQ